VALLALIASAAEGSIGRDRLLGLLWPDRDERVARHLLADSLYVLRQTLGDGAIVATADSVRLSADFLWTDVAEFRRALAEERWSDAVALKYAMARSIPRPRASWLAGGITGTSERASRSNGPLRTSRVRPSATRAPPRRGSGSRIAGL
jgi:hypothetical protein